jgi:hypothetical protein
MRLSRSFPLLAALVSLSVLTAAPALAQEIEVPQPSPSAKVQQRVGITDFTVEYSSPAVKGRKVWGELVPLDKQWRTGANQATKLIASREFKFGDKTVPAGTYGLYSIPGKDSWTVALNSGLENPLGYDAAKDVARVTAKPEASPHRERLTLLFSDTTDASTRLDIEWEKVRVSVPLTVDTKAHVNASIDKSIGGAWRPHFTAARYLLESGGDLNKALVHADTSIAVKPTWWNHWVRAQILAKQGKRAEAVKTAARIPELGKGDEVYEGFFKPQVEKTVAEWKAAK